MIQLRNLQRRVALDLAWLRRFAGVALEQCRDRSADERFALRGLDEISVAIVSDRRIAQVHEEFMNVQGATDVITFDYGEIVISAETARRAAGKFGGRVEHEIGLYLMHGLLHLNGFDDRTRADRARMFRAQGRIMKACLARLRGE